MNAPAWVTRHHVWSSQAGADLSSGDASPWRFGARDTERVGLGFRFAHAQPNRSSRSRHAEFSARRARRRRRVRADLRRDQPGRAADHRRAEEATRARACSRCSPRGRRADLLDDVADAPPAMARGVRAARRPRRRARARAGAHVHARPPRVRRRNHRAALPRGCALPQGPTGARARPLFIDVGANAEHRVDAVALAGEPAGPCAARVLRSSRRRRGLRASRAGVATASGSAAARAGARGPARVCAAGTRLVEAAASATPGNVSFYANAGSGAAVRGRPRRTNWERSLPRGRARARESAAAAARRACARRRSTPRRRAAVADGFFAARGAVVVLKLDVGRKAARARGRARTLRRGALVQFECGRYDAQPARSGGQGRRAAAGR